MGFTNVTKQENLVMPKPFGDWIVRNSTATNRLIQSGIIKPDDRLGQQLNSMAGLTLTVPVLNDLPGISPQEWNDSHDIETNSLTSDQEEEVKWADVQSFASTDYGDVVSGADTQQRIAERFGNYWSNVDENRVIKLVQNMFLNPDIAKVKGFHLGSEKELNAGDFIGAISRMGDIGNQNLTKLVVNSATRAMMERQNLIQYIQPSVGGQPIQAYNGKEIIEDDAIPVDKDGKTYALIFAQGAIQYSTSFVSKNGVVVTRDEFQNGGETAIINKRFNTCHVVGTTLDYTQLDNGINGYRQQLEDNTKSLYKIAGDPRNIQIIKYGFTIDNDLIVPSINAPAEAKAASKTTSK